MKQHRRYLFFEFLKEFHGHPVVPRNLPFGEGFDGVSDILKGEVLVSLSFMACVTLVGAFFQQTVCTPAVPGANASEEYRLA